MLLALNSKWVIILKRKSLRMVGKKPLTPEKVKRKSRGSDCIAERRGE